jgi:putative ABC transport system ATP-binding protein
MQDDILPNPSLATPGQTFTGYGQSLISVSGLYKQFDLHSGPAKVLRNINFDIPNGGFAVIFGPSGSGKTTLLNVLSGLELPTKGRVAIASQDIYALNADQRAHFRAQNIGMVHQENYWVNSLNVLENVAMPLYLTGCAKKAANYIAKDSLKKVGMADYADYSPTLLSGGQQQRVSMARALVAAPKLIFADEPTGDLDTKNGRMIIDLLLYFQRDLGRTIVLVTHNPRYLSYSNTQLHMLDGKITATHRDYKTPVSGDPLEVPVAEPTGTETTETEDEA